MSESIDRLLKELLDGWNEHNANKVMALYAPDYEEEDVAAATKHYGPNAARGSMLIYLRAFPDLRLISDGVIMQGTDVALSWIMCGTHQGRLMNIPATGRSVKLRGISLLTLDGGLIRRTRRVWDVAGLLRSFGLLPELA